jgi:hypothetical protein
MRFFLADARLLNLVEIKQKNEMCKYIHPIIP